ncbi:MAG: prepilin-type N-terminal cleavage/methylation domain-containing protein [Proteobacteria bacterium]|nr:prepilin-type N-terminal cleavage/methylation domain-containing protein [Pseudomonadota bacterium]MDP2107263.1 prepilin-type N-terminal cleavage/methylation domain-containing protein [Desulfobulbaceae bacterium]
MANLLIKNNNGFTLIEVLVTITVLSIGILGAGAMQLSVLNGNAGSYDLTEATALALDQVENIIALDYNDPLFSDDNDTPYQRIGDQVVGGGLMIRTINSVGDNSVVSDNYTIFMDITDNVPAIDSKTIRVDVVWTEGDKLKTVSMNYIKTRY